MKRVLFFMPDNPLKKNAGNKIRALSFLHYFKSRGYDVHYISEYFWGEWTEEDISLFNTSGLASVLHVLHRKPLKQNILSYFFSYKLPEFFYEKKWGLFPLNFPEMVTYRLKRAFNQILRRNQYDYIFINYASWSGLIAKNPLIGSAKTVLDTHDFLTAQYQDKFDIGASFKEEINRLSLFDEVLAISIEEQYIFDQFCKNKIRLAPMMIAPPAYKIIPFAARKFDLIYVASKNPHNVEAFAWFMESVYPLLHASISICIIGQITEYIPGNYPNIIAIPFAEQLNEYYQDARVALCPMLSGTGTKIKVVEALSYGIPVVCNSRGVDGLLNKTNNGCLVGDSPHDFSQNIRLLLSDPETYDTQSSYAKETFESGYQQETCYHKLDQIFK